MSIVVSVVVPTYRREDLLRKCLECLRNQSFTERYEIIVADDGPTEATRQVVNEVSSCSSVDIRYLAVRATQGPAGARNAAWTAARGEFIAFTDDDCLPARQWLAAGVQALRSENADAATGRTVVPLPPWPTDAELDVGGLATAEFITANLFCRQATLAEVGGFDERFTRAWREDSDLHFTLFERGKRIVVAADAIVVHPARRGPWGVSLSQQAKGLFDPLLYRKHPQLYRRHIAPIPWFYYVAVGGLMGTIVGSLSGRPLLLLVSLSIWSCVSLAFATSRLRATSHRASHVVEMLVTSALIPPLSLYWRWVGWWKFRQVTSSLSHEAECAREGPCRESPSGEPRIVENGIRVRDFHGQRLGAR